MSARPNAARERSTAIHEAGHAIVGLALGLQPRRVSIVPDEDSLGHVENFGFARVVDYKLDPEGHPRRVYRPWSPEYDDPRRLDRRIIVCMAGVTAERLVVGRRYNWVGAAADMRTATGWLLYFQESDRTTDRHSAYLWSLTGDLVEHSREDIEALADALLVKRTMTRADIEAWQRQQSRAMSGRLNIATVTPLLPGV
jgi:hypothetical protein